MQVHERCLSCARSGSSQRLPASRNGPDFPLTRPLSCLHLSARLSPARRPQWVTGRRVCETSRTGRRDGGRPGNVLGRRLPRPVPVLSTMLSDKVQTWGTCLQGSVSWPGGRGITWDLCVILFFLFNGICIFTALIIWNLLEMITTLRIDQQLTQTGYNQTNASLVNKSLNV